MQYAIFVEGVFNEYRKELEADLIERSFLAVELRAIKDHGRRVKNSRTCDLISEPMELPPPETRPTIFERLQFLIDKYPDSSWSIQLYENKRFY